MKQYRIFIIAFCLSAIALMAFMIQYITLIRHLISDNVIYTPGQANPFAFLGYFLSPLLIVSFVALGFFSLLYRILGIVMVARNKTLQGGEQALWIIGFVFVGFITGIVFLALAKSKQMIANEDTKSYSDTTY